MNILLTFMPYKTKICKQPRNSMNTIHFEKATSKYRDTIFKWLEEPHVKEFWDNSQAHKDDIENFINGRKEPSEYADGRYVYWIGLLDTLPFCLLMTIQEFPGEDRPDIKEAHLSRTGHTFGIDYMIGSKDHFGKGLGAKTLDCFTEFFQREVEQNADTFLIDPDESNPRAKHVYSKAGFKHVGDFIMGGKGVFAGRKTHLMEKKMPILQSILNICCKIRKLEQDDFSELNHHFGESSRFKKQPKTWEHYLICQNENTREIRVIAYNSNVIGLGTLVFDSKYPSFQENQIFEINDLLIADPYQGHGLGKILLSSLEDAAREHGAKKVGLGVGLYKDYGPAQRLYYKLGYIPDGHGITYDYKNVTPGNSYQVDDELILWLTKLL